MASLALYAHSMPKSGANSGKQVTIVLHGEFNDHEAIARTLARYLRTGAPPTAVVIFGMESHANFINEVLSEGSAFKARLAVSWGVAEKNNRCFGIVFNGDNKLYRTIGLELTAQELDAEVKLAATMVAQEIFISSGCLQTAPNGSHYSKTSKAHSIAFIRASNALIKSANTLSLAFFLLPFVSQPASRILVDTSAIASVIYAACHIAVQAGSLATLPIIDSFQSYEGLSDADLEDVENTLFVISASTSGNLARKAFGKGVKKDRLKTIYLLSVDQADQDAICCLRKGENNPDGLELFKSWNEGECPMCQAGSVPVQIGGDLFLTALPETASIMLLKRHLPEQQKEVIASFSGLGVFRAHRRIGERTAEISIDLEPVFTQQVDRAQIVALKDEWQRLLRANVPANISHIIYPEYPYAQPLADGINSFGAQFLKVSPNFTSGIDLNNSPIADKGCAIVASPCLDDPAELMGINRDLRNKIPGGTANYLFPLIRAQSASQAKGIVTNLTFGDRGAGTYNLHRLYELYLPEDRDDDPWSRELKCLKLLADSLEETGEEVPGELKARIKQLYDSTGSGLIDSLFWPDSNGKALAIRTNFVLLPTQDGKQKLDQADIFVVISALLNNIRQLDGKESLKSNQHQRRVIDPGNFLRFNDGIIQAAILRAARGGELNYASTENGAHSENITDQILKMIDRVSSEDGEALTEFVLAIALGTLRLEGRDLNWIIKTVLESAEKVPKIVALLVRALKNRSLPAVNPLAL